MQGVESGSLYEQSVYVCEFVLIIRSDFYCIAVPTVAIDIGGLVLAGVREGMVDSAATGDLGHVTVNMPSIRLAVMSVCLMPAGSCIER